MLSTSKKDTLTGWACTAKGEPLKEMELPLKTWDENCVDMEIICCGMCGTDIHTLEEKFGSCTNWPCVIGMYFNIEWHLTHVLNLHQGHEIVGKVTRVGKNVTNVCVGDRGGVGFQADSCGKCEECLKGNENMCTVRLVQTYNDNWYNGDKTYGGYANRWRGDYRFICKIPDSMTSEIAASFMCAGLTMYAPLKRAVSSKSVVGIMGIGGLGHFAILFAKAMGAKVVAMSQTASKRSVALELGADEFLVTSDLKAMGSYKKQWIDYFNLLKAKGHFINLMLGDWEFPPIDPALLCFHQVYIHGTLIGSPKEIEEMLAFADEHEIKPWITTYPMSKANEALEYFKARKPRFRLVLKN
ncbi:conserved hypothetical protein [Mucor ambiguus]|uniref:Enoyl reductase (ER) domain-containing protein n=1 Tax=Mucor ambiguus TaxID=91626 RepID=A0A0C9MR31_9FUNG|nr:conserved hypothetical protein [Mucor ambiguus]